VELSTTDAYPLTASDSFEPILSVSTSYEPFCTSGKYDQSADCWNECGARATFFVAITPPVFE
jgi:hypothetical protein